MNRNFEKIARKKPRKKSDDTRRTRKQARNNKRIEQGE